MTKRTVSEARESFASVLAEVATEPVEIFRHGERVAVIVSPTMYDASVEALEDKADEEAFDAVDRDDTIPWDEIKSELGLA
jgi:prevent-host-death family protein